MGFEQNYRYFRCAWIVTPLSADSIRSLLSSAADMGVTFYSEVSFKDTDRCWIIPFIAQVKSEEILQELVGIIGQTYGMTDWQPVESVKWDQWHSLMISAFPDFVKGVQTMGNFNAKIKKCFNE